MKGFRLPRNLFRDEDILAEVEALMGSVSSLKKSEKRNHSALLALLAAYLQKPYEDIDPEQKEEISLLCENLGGLFDCIQRSNSIFQNEDKI